MPSRRVPTGRPRGRPPGRGRSTPLERVTELRRLRLQQQTQAQHDCRQQGLNARRQHVVQQNIVPQPYLLHLHQTINPPLAKPGVPNGNHTLQSKIAAKLESLFNGFVSDLQNISKEKKPDLAVLFDTQHVSNFVNCSQVANHVLSSSDHAFEDDSTLVLQNFINSAKSRISELLNKEQAQFEESKDGVLKTTHESFPEKTDVDDPLQVQISLKVQSLLCKALDNGKLTADGKSQNGSSRNVNELQDLSQMLQDFMAKKKLSLPLSKDSSVSVQSENTGYKSSSWKSQQCPTVCSAPQVSPCTDRLPFASSELNSNAQLLRPEKKNLNCLPSLGRSTTSIHSPKMYSHLSDSDSLESATFCIPKADMSCSYGNGGMLLLEDSERAPEYLDLEINSEVKDEPGTDSDEEVIVLGEKRPTYEEITLEDEDEGPENKNPEGDEVEEFLFNCPKCEKVFRVESLLNFHVRMHGIEDPSLASASKVSLENSSVNGDKSCSTKSSKTFQSSTRKEKENKTKSKSKNSTHKRKSHREKQHKYDKKKNICKHS